MPKDPPNLEVILGPLPALSCVELGVVIRAARAAWERAGCLPKRREVLERLLRGVTPGELEAGWSALLAQLIDVPGGDEYTWPAVRTAWEEARAVERRRSRAARAGALARWAGPETLFDKKGSRPIVKLKTKDFAEIENTTSSTFLIRLGVPMQQPAYQPPYQPPQC